MTACSAFGCSRRPQNKTPGITFHKFPLNEERRRKWILNVRRKNWMPSKCSTLCSDHFTEDMFDRTSLCCVRLREHAVPTIFKGFPSHLQQGGKSRKPPKHRAIMKNMQDISRMPSERRKGLPPERRKKRMPPPPTKNFFFDDQDLDSEESYTSDLQSQDDTVDNSPMAIELIHTDVRDFIFKLVYDGKRDMAVISSLVQMFSERELFQLDKSQRRFYPDKQTISMVVSQAKSKMEKTDEDNDTTNLEVCNSNTDDVSVREIQVINLTDQDKDHTDGENDMNNSCMEEILSDHEEAEPELSESKEPLLHKCEAKLQSIQSAMVFLDKQDLIKLSKRLNNVCKTLCNQVTIDNYSTSALELSFPTE